MKYNHEYTKWKESLLDKESIISSKKTKKIEIYIYYYGAKKVLSP
jgi:hypothetical protein